MLDSLVSAAPMTPSELDNYKLHRRFDRLGRLVGDGAMKKLMDSHVMVIGLGGVGSWAAESLARSGVGTLSMVDFDLVCVTNTNRQIHTLQTNIGKPKAEVMAERLRQINPRLKAVAINHFFNEDHAEKILQTRPDFIIDAIDNLTAKSFLLAYCRKENIPVVTSTGSSGRLDPTQVEVKDLAETTVDPLARELRKILRQKHGFPEEGKLFGIPAVFSKEPATEPFELHYDGGKGFRCVCPNGDNQYFQCENRNVILGNAGFVTGAFGLVCASVAVRHLLAAKRY